MEEQVIDLCLGTKLLLQFCSAFHIEAMIVLAKGIADDDVLTAE